MMSGASARDEIGLEVIAPDHSRRFVRITESPFLIGRGTTGKHLQLTDSRISRQCAAIILDDGQYYLEDRGQRHGIFVNGGKITRCRLEDGDVISFNVDNFYELTFRSSDFDTSIPEILSRIESISASDTSHGGLHKLNLLLEATALLHSRLPLNAVLSTVLDHAIAITDADRGVMLAADPGGRLSARLARRNGGKHLPHEQLAPSQTALRLALEQQSGVITEDLAKATLDLQGAASIVGQQLRAVVVIPLYAMVRAGSTESVIDGNRGELLGAVYLDSRRPAAFSNLDRRILDALALEAASILENARLVERDRQRQRLEQEIGIARGIQQALLPRSFSDSPHLAVSGINIPCRTVGGDYFDVFPIDEDRTAFLIADVSGKGLGAALLATMLQGALLAIKMGAEPASVLEHINCFLCEHPEVDRYATVFLGVLDRRGQIEFVNAGHPSPILLRSGQGSEPFDEGSFPVGMMPDAKYHVVRGQLQPEDTLVLFSDGVTEAEDPDQQLFGASRLRKVLEGRHRASLDQLQEALLDSVRDFARGAGQTDDITLVLLRYRAADRQQRKDPTLRV
jgi:phosphoserine phosphatase RsbU/P